MNRNPNQQQCSYTPSADVYSQSLGGEAVLLDVRSGRYWGLDEVGTRIWELLEQGRPVEAVIETLVDEYDAAPEILERDTREFVETLAAGGFFA